MRVPIEHPFPSINPARTGAGSCGGGPPARPCRPTPALRSRTTASRSRRLNRKSMSAPVGIVASFSRAVLASPECAWHHQNTAFTRLIDVSPRWLRRTALSCEFTPPSIHGPDLPELSRPAPEGPTAARHHGLRVLREEPTEELLEPRRGVVVPHRRRRAAGRAPPPLGPR